MSSWLKWRVLMISSYLLGSLVGGFHLDLWSWPFWASGALWVGIWVLAELWAPQRPFQRLCDGCDRMRASVRVTPDGRALMCSRCLSGVNWAEFVNERNI